ncbi:antirestriction protein [Gluconobacter cerinus]|uniref:antirestriction protein n=1 Tax=Gluconobacter cerinus TaxID=38307 RepID=UPI001B8B2F69|nr:antirestriction protein [Gluconobacter cerinus]MBS0984252.1 antirestriction protein [Gluconobacter cerinus]
MSENSINISIVPQSERFSFLPSMFGNGTYLEGESTVYAYMSALCREYTGGYWNYAYLSNGGRVMLPEMEETTVTISVRLNGYQGQMTPNAAGIVCCLFALSGLSCKVFQTNPEAAELIAERYHQLRDFALEHAEREAILAAID